MAHTNVDILSTILNHFLQPVVHHFTAAKLSSFPIVQAIENKVKSTGWVSQSWSLANDVAPVVEPFTESLVQPMIRKYLSSIPDDAIPALAHNVVDKAIKNGGLNLLEGKLEFELSDLQELKKLLMYNLPISQKENYQILTEDNTIEHEN